MIDASARTALETLLGEAVAFDVPMGRFTSLRIGGPADAVATPRGLAELADLLGLLAELGLRQHVLGSGFNTLVLDEGIDGVVIRLDRLRRVERVAPDRVRAEAGASHASVVGFCERNGLAGMEFAVGIPGTVGGWLAMNAGIGRREMKHVVRQVESVSPGHPGVRVQDDSELEFGYRCLHGLAPRAVVTAASFEVEPSDPACVRQTMKQHLAHRSETQPVTQPSCGSVFKNPAGDHAGRLIEAVGLKGETHGAARISERHANFIVNLGGAKASDVLALIQKTRACVAERTGIELEPEVRVLGRSTP